VPLAIIPWLVPPPVSLLVYLRGVPIRRIETAWTSFPPLPFLGGFFRLSLYLQGLSLSSHSSFDTLPGPSLNGGLSPSPPSTTMPPTSKAPQHPFFKRLSGPACPPSPTTSRRIMPGSFLRTPATPSPRAPSGCNRCLYRLFPVPPEPYRLSSEVSALFISFRVQSQSPSLSCRKRTPVLNPPPSPLRCS